MLGGYDDTHAANAENALHAIFIGENIAGFYRGHHRLYCPLATCVVATGSRLWMVYLSLSNRKMGAAIRAPQIRAAIPAGTQKIA